MPNDTAERIGKLAERFDPMPPQSDPPTVWAEWDDRFRGMHGLLAIATPGALLGAAVDLFDFALAGKGWHIATCSYSTVRNDWEVVIQRADPRKLKSAIAPTAAAALLAAMEEV